MKCTICNKEKNDLMTYVNEETQKKDYVCTECQINNNTANSTQSDVEEEIRLIENLIDDMEIKFSDPKLLNMEVPPGLEALAFTPKKMFLSAYESLALLKLKRMELKSLMPREKYLEEELKIAIEKENFEKAALLRQKIEDLKNEK